ncbi:hypothetical protein D1007_59133 [Hordeum vulgare]|nr:hypothetical protein D1007_59133 [Hordeum vulgare]
MGSVSSPLVPDDAGYLDFFTNKVVVIVDEECRDLLGQALTRVCSQLLRANPRFDSEAVMVPVPEGLRGALAEAVEDHVGLSSQFVPGNCGDPEGAEEPEGADSDGSDASP